MTYQITLYRGTESWMATSTDPKVKRLFGTDTLPVAFTAQADQSTVLREIQRLNPGFDVRLKP